MDSRDSFPHFNYAIPGSPERVDMEPVLPVLEAAFVDRSRIPHFEFIEQYAPCLGPALRQNGFIEQGKQALMVVCTPETFQPTSESPGLTITEMNRDSTAANACLFLTAQDARAGRVYERVGFQEFATLLTYLDPS